MKALTALTNQELAAKFWESEWSAAVREGGRLDRYLPAFLFGEPRYFEAESDNDLAEFYTSGRYLAIAEAVLVAWKDALEERMDRVAETNRELAAELQRAGADL